jgi:small subunit ribosomal protein S6
MNCYETLIVVKPTLTEEEIAKQVEQVKQNITEQNGEVAGVNEMGMRKLAYEINKNARGFYAVIYHKSPASAIEEVERKLRYNEDILRFFTVKYSNKKEIAEFEKQVASCNGKKEETSAKEEASSEA